MKKQRSENGGESLLGWQTALAEGGALCLAGPQKAIKSMHVTAKLNRTKCSSQLLGTKALSWRQDHNQFPKFS